MAKRMAPLARPKTMFATASAAWKSLHKQTGLNPSQVRAQHTAKAWFWKVIGSAKRTSKSKKKTSKSVKTSKPKTRKNNPKRTSNPKSKNTKKKSLAGKKGVAGMTRLKKFLLGLGIGAGVSTVAGLTKVREVEFIGPVVDAGLSGGVEGQLGVALPKIIRLIANRGGFSLGNGGGGLANEGA